MAKGEDWCRPRPVRSKYIGVSPPNHPPLHYVVLVKPPFRPGLGATVPTLLIYFPTSKYFYPAVERNKARALSSAHQYLSVLINFVTTLLQQKKPLHFRVDHRSCGVYCIQGKRINPRTKKKKSEIRIAERSTSKRRSNSPKHAPTVPCLVLFFFFSTPSHFPLAPQCARNAQNGPSYYGFILQPIACEL
jgi:hypothetical protein